MTLKVVDPGTGNPSRVFAGLYRFGDRQHPEMARD
jgi:hypothetical protein